MKEMKQIEAQYIPVLYHNVSELLRTLGATGTYVLTGSGVYVGILKKLTEKEHPIHDLDIKLIPDNPLNAARVLTMLSFMSGKDLPLSEYFTIKGEPDRFDFVYQGVPVNVWLMLDPIRYEVFNIDEMKCDGNWTRHDVEINIENLDDIFLAKAKMGRPKDRYDIEALCWKERDYTQEITYENIIHPWVLDSERPLSSEEKNYVLKAEVIAGQFDNKSIMFTCSHDLEQYHRYGENRVLHYISVDEHSDNYNNIPYGEIPVDSITWAIYKRFNSTETRTLVRIK